MAAARNMNDKFTGVFPASDGKNFLVPILCLFGPFCNFSVIPRYL
jgi:hypothetical protein